MTAASSIRAALPFVLKPREGLTFRSCCPAGAHHAARSRGRSAHCSLAQNPSPHGSRVRASLELKTVRSARPASEIPRPCIDAPGEGYNVEWSQELTLDRSRREYATARYLIHILRARYPSDTGAHIDLRRLGRLRPAGIRSASVAKFPRHDDGHARAARQPARVTAVVAARDRRRARAGAAFDTVTPSSFHGCPPDEIERIVEHLLTRHALHVVVKLNPDAARP